MNDAERQARALMGNTHTYSTNPLGALNTNRLPLTPYEQALDEIREELASAGIGLEDKPGSVTVWRRA